LANHSGSGQKGKPENPKQAFPPYSAGFPLAKDDAAFLTSAMDSQLKQYFPVLFLALVAVVFAGGTLILSLVVGRWANARRLTNPAKTKNIPYECGMLPIGEGSSRLSVKFYLVAMLFILFDIEVVFLYPWAVVYREMLLENANLIFGSMVSFVGILFVGYIYALKKRAFDWKS